MSKTYSIYIDVDETFLRNYGSKQIAIPHMIEHIKTLYQEGARLYCWSSGGANYAHNKAKEFGIEECFVAFLDKPHAIIDDMKCQNWNKLIEIHPNQCRDANLEMYIKILEE